MRVLIAVFILCILSAPWIAAQTEEEQDSPILDRMKDAVRWLPRMEYERIAYMDAIAYRAQLTDIIHPYENTGVPVKYSPAVPPLGGLCEPFPLPLLEYDFVRLAALTPKGEWLYVFVGDDLQYWYDEAIGAGYLVMDVRGIGGRITYRLAVTREYLPKKELFCYQPHERVLLVATVPDYLDLMTHAGRGITKSFTTHPYYSHFLREPLRMVRYDPEIVIDYEPVIDLHTMYAFELPGGLDLRTGIAPGNPGRLSLKDCRAYSVTSWRLALPEPDTPLVDRWSSERTYAFPAIARDRQDIDERELQEVVVLMRARAAR